MEVHERVIHTVTGACDRCGKPVGRLAATDSLYNNRYPLIDSVLYHLTPHLTSTRIGCNEPD